MSIVTADLFDRHAATIGVCDLQFRNFGKRQSFFGRCRTLVLFEDHLPLRELVSQPGEGDVLVIDAGGSLRVGVIGDKLAARAATHGWAGIVLNGAIRDSVAIGSIEIGMKALGTTARKGLLPCQPHAGIPVNFGGARFAPGDWIYADADCVLVSHIELEVRP